MATIKRSASATWEGNLKDGKGAVSTESGALDDVAYSFRTRFKDAEGSNPEELLAAAHAGCFSMAFAATLAEKGYDPQSIETQATCSLAPLDGGGFEITAMKLLVRGRVPDIDPDLFAQIAEEADAGCPVSNLLRPGLEISHDVSLV